MRYLKQHLALGTILSGSLESLHRAKRGPCSLAVLGFAYAAFESLHRAGRGPPPFDKGGLDKDESIAV